MPKEYKLAVEFQPTGVPKPVGVTVFADRSPVAFLTLEQLREVIREFEKMEAVYQQTLPKP